MHKWMYLWAPSGDASIGGFAARTRGMLEERLKGLCGEGASEVTLHLTESEPPRLSIVPFQRKPVALVSVTGGDEAVGAATSNRLTGLEGSVEGYLVEEAIPLFRQRRWPLGEAAPGVCLLTLLRRNQKLSRESFLGEWHGRHTPMSLAVHPMESYVRNTVMEPIGPIDHGVTQRSGTGPAASLGDGRWDGIVTEAYPTMRHLTNPLYLFGGPLRALPNMLRVGRHIATFMDLRSMRNFLVTERVIEARS